MSNLNENDFIELLNGQRNGGYYQSNHFVVMRQNKKPTKEDILLEGKVGLPHNMNEVYDKNLGKKNSSKKRKIDSDLLRYLSK